MHAKEIMIHPAITCPLGGTLDHAARLMWEFDCGALPVVDDAGKAVGMVTDRDICMAAYTQGRPLREISVTTAMAKQVVGIRADEPVDRAQEMMQANRIRRLPVLDEESRPVGMVSMNDLARLAARARKSGVDRDLVETLATICEPRAHVRAFDGELMAPVIHG